ncbi:ATP-binding protein [Paracidovorax citrulli]
MGGSTDPDAEGSEPAYPGTRRYFRAQRRALQILLAGVVILPAVLLSTWAALALQGDTRQAEMRAARLTRVLQEHARNLLATDLQVNNRIRELTSGLDDEALRARQRELHVRLADIAGAMPQTVSLSIFDIRGTMVASSRTYPVPPLSIAEREDFRAVVNAPLDPRQPAHVTAVHTARLSQQPIFNISMPRLDPAGKVSGMVSVAMRPAYFADFYEEVLAEERGARAALVRRDGAVLAAYPRLDRATIDSPLRDALQRESAGPLDWVSRMAGMTGQDSLVARLPVNAGLHAVVEIPMHVVYLQWRNRVVTALWITLLPSLLLWTMVWVSLRRLRREEQSHLRWQHEMTLRQQVEERYRQARRLEAVGHLMTSVAHDFRNVLSVISVNTDLLIARPDAGRERALAGIRKAVASGVALSGQLIGMARKRAHRKEVLSLAQEAEGWSPLLRSTLGGRIRLRYDIAADCARVCADRSELELAMINLAANARDAMPEGGTVTISASNVHLDGGRPTGLRGNFVSVRVRDTGTGMTPEVAGRAFEPLFTTKEADLGTGLGLAQVHDFCREVDGAAVIASQPGKGTEVSLYLPAWQRADQMHHEPGAHAGGSSVLLVADQARTVQGAFESLQGSGHRVMLVHDEAGALAAAERFGFDLVITDARLGAALSGLTLRERLVASYPFLPVLLMTDDADMMALAAVSGLPFLLKPWNAHTLVRHGILMPAVRSRSGQSSASRL